MTGKRGRPKGHRLSQATKDQIAKSKTGYVHDQETKDKIANSLVEYFDSVGRKLISMKMCPRCFSLFIPHNPVPTKYCDDCINDIFKGDGEYKKYRNKISGRKKYKLWRFQVLLRDNFICQICHAPGNCAHHLVDILKLKNHPELLYSPDIGLTLCRECHGRLHWTIKQNAPLEQIK